MAMIYNFSIFRVPISWFRSSDCNTGPNSDTHLPHFGSRNLGQLPHGECFPAPSSSKYYAASSMNSGLGHCTVGASMNTIVLFFYISTSIVIVIIVLVVSASVIVFVSTTMMIIVISGPICLMRLNYQMPAK